MESHRRGTPPDEGPNVELLGVVGPRRVDEHTVHTQPPRRWWFGIGALAVVVLVGVLVASNEGASESAPSTTTPTTLPTPSTTERRAGPLSTLDAPLTTAAPVPDALTVRELGDAPLLGEETGAWLLLTDLGLRAVDLDAGRLVDLGMRVDQAWRRDRWLVVSRQGRFERLDLATFATEPLDVEGQVTADPASAGQVWFRETDDRADGADRLVRVDLAAGTVVETIDVPAGWAQWGPWLDVQLVGSPRSGGVYRLTADGPVQLLEAGVLLASTDRRHLVERCDPELRCELGWIDDDGAAVTSLAVPPAGFDAVRVLGTGAWLAVERWGAGYELTVFDAASGRSVDIVNGNWIEDVIVSPDGRWLLMNRNGRLEVLDLSDAEPEAVDVGAVFGSSLVWLDEPLDLEAVAVAQDVAADNDGAGEGDGS
ncbi:MAG: hypothetical protein ACRBI6_01600 [Acidimicrobiales bacterium]